MSCRSAEENMGSSEKNIDNQVLSQLKQNSSTVVELLDQLSCTHSDIVKLLVEYQVMSEQDDDQFDNWYDALCDDKLKVLKAFEILRAQLERSLSE